MVTNYFSWTVWSVSEKNKSTCKKAPLVLKKSTNAPYLRLNQQNRNEIAKDRSIQTQFQTRLHSIPAYYVSCALETLDSERVHSLCTEQNCFCQKTFLFETIVAETKNCRVHIQSLFPQLDHQTTCTKRYVLENIHLFQLTLALLNVLFVIPRVSSTISTIFPFAPANDCYLHTSKLLRYCLMRQLQDFEWWETA